jgi:zinc transport system substrate-binding protein
MQEVAVWMRLGEPNEEKLMRALKEKNNNLVIVELWKEAPLLDGCCRGEADLHFWLNPKLASNQAEKMAQALCTLFPEHKEIYLKNLKALQQELANLDKEIAERLAPLQGQAILASHPAFGYFCKEYGLIQLSIECEGKEPRPKQIAALLQQAKAAHVRVVLTQAQYSNKGAELVAKKLALPTTLVDPYSKDYVNNLLHLAEVIAHDN